MLDKLQKLVAQLPYVPRAWRLIWTVARGWTMAWLVLLVLQGLLPLALVYVARDLVDELSQGVQSNFATWDFTKTIWLVVLLAAVTLIGEGLNSFSKWIRAAQAERVQDHISELIQTKATTLDMSFFDHADYYDRLYRAQTDALSRPVALLENAGNLLQSGLTFVAMAGVLFTFGWWVPLTLLVGVIPVLLVVLRATLKEHAWRQKNTLAQRSINYYGWMLTERESAAEIRLFGLGAHFRKIYQTIRERLRNEHHALLREQAFAELFASSFAWLAMGAVLAWMVWRAGTGKITLGSLALFYQAFNQGQRLMHTLLGSVAQIYSNVLFLENLFEFLDLEPQQTRVENPLPVPTNLQSGIIFQDITFHYPDSKRTALDQFNLHIPAGQIVAIVGENGAGKSTLIKLLCRFYDPDEGVVTLDGTSLRNFAPEDLQRRITVLFQQPVHYYTSVEENVKLGDIVTTSSRKDVLAAAVAAGADSVIERLPDGYDTMLGKWFGGAELSGGEWQRIALARAFLRKAPLIILDEPTSAMDSWAEADWMSRFRSLVEGRTALIITHRFTTAMQADVIHVMDEGKVIESGTHVELMEQNGKYAQSWRQQTQATNSGDESKK